MSSRSYRLKAREGTGEGLKRIAEGRAAEATDGLANTGEKELAAAIHGARKDLKKLRAVLRLARKQMGKDLFKAEDRRYRDAGRLLSRTRDAEVKLETLAALRSQFSGDLPPEGSKRWVQVLEEERDEVTGAGGGEASRQIDQARNLIAEGLDRVGDWPLKSDSWRLLGPGLSKSYREGRRAMKRVQGKPNVENVHEWRKRAKDLWYQLRIVQGAWPQLLGATVDQAHELSDLLGDHHDLALLDEDLAARRDIVESEAFRALIERRQEELLARALELGRRLYAEKPKAFSRRLERYWLAWREKDQRLGPKRPKDAL
jgi:CHAD domain-containing protein